MAGRIEGAAPPKPGPRLDIIRVTTTNWQSFTILSTAIFGQNIHWAHGRSSECTKDKSLCDGCVKFWPAKWKGYLHVFHHETRKQAFLEMTPNLAEQLLEAIPENECFRGFQVRICKSKGGAKGRYHSELLATRLTEDRLTKEKDPYLTLKFLWACKDRYSRSE